MLKALKSTFFKSASQYNLLPKLKQFWLFHIRDFFLNIFVISVLFLTSLKWAGVSWKKGDDTYLLSPDDTDKLSRVLNSQWFQVDFLADVSLNIL